MRQAAASSGRRHPGAGQGLDLLRGVLAARTQDPVPASVQETLRESGRPLEAGLRREHEARLGADFSQVRVHTDPRAAQSARDIGALAYTAGRDIVFGENRYAPQSAEGGRLLAHELTHVAQQRGAAPAASELRLAAAGDACEQQAEAGAGQAAPIAAPAGVVQRAPDPKDVAAFDKEITKLKTHAEYGKLGAPSRKQFDEIVDIARKRDRPLYYSTWLKALFDTPEQPAAAQAADTRKDTADAAKGEKKRLTRASALARYGAEEKVSAGKSRVFSPAVGLDGVTTFELDARDPTDIAVKAKVQLTKAGAGTSTDVANVKTLEDAIEKRTSMLGYSVDLKFVNAPGPDVFSVEVDTSGWTTSGNWVGDEIGLVHELHHLLGLAEDRYNYIESHAKNPKMKIVDRLHWFRQELSKIIDNNERSMMNSGENLPLDDDVCMVAGNKTKAGIDACVKKRAAARETKLKPGLSKAADRARKANTVLAAGPAGPKGAAAPTAQQTKAEGVAVSVFGKPLAASLLAKTIQNLPLQLTLANLRLTSLLTAGCDTRAALTDARAPHILLCPDFLGLSDDRQARALLVASLHLEKVGGAGTDKDCAKSGCASACGDETNAQAWARFVECCESI